MLWRKANDKTKKKINNIIGIAVTWKHQGDQSFSVFLYIIQNWSQHIEIQLIISVKLIQSINHVILNTRT